MNYMQFAKEVRKEEEAIDELIRWRDSVPRSQDFKEDSDSQRFLLMKDDREIS